MNLPRKIKTIDGYTFTLSDDASCYTDGDLSWELSELVFYSPTNGILGSDRIPFVATTNTCDKCDGFGWTVQKTYVQVESTVICGSRFIQCTGCN